MIAEADLSAKLRLLGGADNVQLAERLDDAVDKLFEPDGVRRLLGAWTRARRAYCDQTGEPLI